MLCPNTDTHTLEAFIISMHNVHITQQNFHDNNPRGFCCLFVWIFQDTILLSNSITQQLQEMMWAIVIVKNLALIVADDAAASAN